MTASLESQRHGQTLVLSISNPEHQNALEPGIYAAGIEVLNAVENNPELRSVIITGKGPYFCSGARLQRLLENRQQPPELQAQSIDGLHHWIETIRVFPKPVLAAVEGPCAGAGFSLALACDLVVAAQDSVFIMSYSQVGLSPDGGASWSLLRALPRQTALELLLSGERVGADRLQQLGLVNRVSAPGQALADALHWCEKLNARAPNALASIKELVNEASTATLPEQLGRERDHFVRCLHHANAGEGITAFLDKRTPHYR
ncbi:oxepin-CoA hydrolase, alternative type [Hydrogenophaga sp.]|uniref:oxepin-CoA hydrolase, alternative type n=1 Tax=Hydrogenophaga sp. TaxID=1904254 RepID=UPI0019875E03|nr:enoyl-CoA hydratase [Hydrogenophaga sp.]MBD3893712.1 enoyl-CoA hydratase [Hydrogenophaga sp.]